MTKDPELAKRFGKLLVAARDIGEHCVGEGYFTSEDLRLTVAARVERERELIASGMSVREVAKVTGVSHQTVQNDVKGRAVNKVDKSVNKVATPETEPEPDLPDQKTVRERYQRSLLGDCLAAVEEMSKKTRAKFFAQIKEKYRDQI